MNDPTLSQAMIEAGIYQVRYYLEGRFSVQLRDGRSGIGATVSEALANAQQQPTVQVAA
tara:strand:+ start:196 stop:372 length:177 start_codon:yes stop_codon:yes gene_type:complete